jgi:hypothetical protein
LLLLIAIEHDESGGTTRGAPAVLEVEEPSPVAVAEVEAHRAVVEVEEPSAEVGPPRVVQRRWRRQLWRGRVL